MLIHDLFFKTALFTAIMVSAASLYDILWFQYLYGKKHISRSFFVLAILANSSMFGFLKFFNELEQPPFGGYPLFWIIMLIKFAFYSRTISKNYSSDNVLFLPILFPLFATMVTGFLLLQIPYFADSVFLFF